MTTKPKQDLLLLLGEYYHTEVELKEECPPDDTLFCRAHYPIGKKHGI